MASVSAHCCEKCVREGSMMPNFNSDLIAARLHSLTHPLFSSCCQLCTHRTILYCILSLPSLLARVDQNPQFGRSLTVYQDGAQCGPQNPYCNVSHYNVNEKMLFYKKIRLLCIFFPGNIFGGNPFWSKLEKKKTLI